MMMHRTKLEEAEESRTRSEESSMKSAMSGCRSTGLTHSWESELTSIQHSLKFVLKLKEEFVCPVCGGVVLNAQQNSCGHIYCFHCLHGLVDSSSSSIPVCPVDGHLISPAEVFQDNCCKREIANLEVFCTNSPACTAVTTLHGLQEHLSQCPYEQQQCTSAGCTVVLPRRTSLEHACPYRVGPCPPCGQQQQQQQQQQQHFRLMQDHVHDSCPDVEVECLDSSSQGIPRPELTDDEESCPEVHVDCRYKTFGCSLQGKQCNMKLHEETAVHHHMVLVLRSSMNLEQQVEDLQREALLKQYEVQNDSLLLTGLQETMQPLLQQSSCQKHSLFTTERTLSRQDDVLSSINLDIQQVSRGLPDVMELEQLKQSVDGVMQEVSTAEAIKEHLGNVEKNLKRQLRLLDLHATQLYLNQQRLQELEALSYDGRLIWKIQNFRKRSNTEDLSCLSSVPFHVGRCGYKMAIKVYLNGDGEGRGTHLSLYVVLMPGDFDELLPWPFRQTVSLSILDQSGARNHHSLSFRPDPASKSFLRPDPKSVSNVAVGFSCFCPLNQLEAGNNATYVRDDTLFVKAKVDMSGLEHL